MYLVISKNKGGDCLSIVKARMDSIAGKKKYKVIRSLEYFKDLKKDY
jgi:hypothetical protein